MSDNRGRIHYGRFTTELRKALVLLCCPVIGFAQLAGPVERLSAVKTVFVDSFGTSDGAAMIQNKVLNRLLKSGRFEVVNSAEAADAVLAGVAERTKGERFSIGPNGGGGGTRFAASSAVRLVSRNQKVLWVDEETNSHWSHSVSSSVADKLVKHLLKAAEEDAKRP